MAAILLWLKSALLFAKNALQLLIVLKAIFGILRGAIRYMVSLFKRRRHGKLLPESSKEIPDSSNNSSSSNVPINNSDEL